jgi:hypothetical protein
VSADHKRLAYADPPYPGKAHLYPENTEVDHAELIERLSEYDGWALSTDEVNLAYVLSLCPPKTRVLAWCKPDAPPMGGGPWQSWEPVLCRPARHAAVRSYLEHPAPARGFCGPSFTGSKPAGFCEWVFRCMGAKRDDSLDDLYPGTGIVGREWETFSAQPPLWVESASPPSWSGSFNRVRRTQPQLPGMPSPVYHAERRQLT